MSGFPQSTEFNRRIPKQKFYENMNISPALKRVFVDQIRAVYWRNKIAATTTNLARGKTVDEIEVIEIRLSVPELDVSALRQIDREIPYHIVFLLEYEDKYQAWICYKEAANGDAFKVGKYYHTGWRTESGLALKLEGLDLDAAYENLVRQIAGDELQSKSEESLKESVVRAERKKQIEKQIAALENKIRKERQLNRQMEMNAELKRLRREMEG